MDKKQFKKIDNEFAIVQKDNQLNIDKLKDEIDTEQETTTNLNVTLDEIAKKLNIDFSSINVGDVKNTDNHFSTIETTLPFEDQVILSKSYLIEQGVNVNDLSTYDLLSKTELREITEYLDRPMYERLKWDKWDYIISFGVGIIAGILDILVGTPGEFLQKEMSDKNSWLGKSMENIHKKHDRFGNAPIDYYHNKDNPIYGISKDGTVDRQAATFGPAGEHRNYSSGHDIFRFLDAIKQFKDGTFRAAYVKDGIKYFVKSKTTQFGNSYQTLSTKEAIISYLIHICCDFFSSKSLPIPGTSWLRESTNREFRNFSIDMYKEGINLRHLLLQGIPPLMINLVIWIYTKIRYRNIDAPKEAIRQKKIELLALSHSICTGFNIGKVIILENPFMLNLPQIIMTCKTLLHLLLLEFNRNDFISKTQRNIDDLNNKQNELEELLKINIKKPIILK